VNVIKDAHIRTGWVAIHALWPEIAAAWRSNYRLMEPLLIGSSALCIPLANSLPAGGLRFRA